MKQRIVLMLAFFLAAVALGQDHPNLGRGFAADKLYDFLGLDTVNNFNGNLVIQLPIGQQYVSNGLVRYRFMLSYNSNVFEYVYSPDGSQLSALPTFLANAGAGWRLSLGSLLPPMGDPDYVQNPGNNTDKWAYVDPASARHGFWPSLHNGDPEYASQLYTRDSSYIRMTIADSDTRNVEFPDGTRQVFKKYYAPANGQWTATAQGTKWRLSSIEDGFGNRVTLSYETIVGQNVSYPEVWHVQDGDRQHDVYFVAALTWFDIVLDHVVLKSSAGVTGTYSMQYRDITAQVTGAGDNEQTWRTFPVLVSITLPDLTQYSMLGGGGVPQYDTGTNTGTPGVLTALQLPTKGSISWAYLTLDLNDAAWDKPTSGPKPSPATVYTRTLTDETGNRGTWTYNRISSNGALTCPCGKPNPCRANDRQMTTWTSKPDGTADIEYFSVYRSGDNCIPGLWSNGDYGLAGTPATTSGSGRLSTERRSSFSAPPNNWTGLGGFDAPVASDVLWTRDFTRYEGEDGLSSASASAISDRNLRPFYFKTTYDGDGGCGGCFLETWLLSFDRFGHYRQKSINGNVPGTPNRTTFTNYPGALDAAGHWVLNVPTEACVADEGSPRTDAVNQCGGLNGFTAALSYDRATGAEIALRVLNSTNATATPNDLLTTRTLDAKGTVTNEQFRGGDTQQLSTTDLFSGNGIAPLYEIRHYPAYSSAGTLTGRRSVYRNASGNDFNATIEDVVLDPYTGAVTTSRDSAGVPTSYSYDAMGRLGTVTPTGLAQTVLSYTPASLAGSNLTRATATVTTQSYSAGTVQQIYEYDAFGRIFLERMLMPDGNWSRIQHAYNSNGQVDKITTQQSESAGCWTSAGGCPATSYLYDASGRARLITAPDSSTTSVTRYAAGRSDATVRSAAGTTNLLRTEKSDALGRLRTVIEQSGPTSATQTTGSDVETTYGYDAQDHLTTVNMTSGQIVQPRSFAYDQRGLLKYEEHGESGRTSYPSYDAKGHVLQRISGGTGGEFDLTFTYDAAERLTFVKDLDSGGQRRTLKQFTFADANNGSNYARGKLSTAIRTNHLTFGDVLVTESYTYSGPAGALNQKDTAVTVSGSPFQTFSQTYTYNDLGAATGVSYPVCATTTPCATTGGISTLSRTFTNGRLTEIGTGSAGSATAYGVITYIPNGMVNEVTHPGSVIDTYAGDATGMPRPTSIRFHGFTTCSSVTITPAAPSMCAGASQNASATIISGASYAWTIDNGAITAGANTSTVTFTAGSGGPTTTLHVSVTSGGCTTTASTSVSVTSSVTITQQPAAVPSTISPNQTAIVSVVASGSNLTYQWYRGARPDTTNPVAGATGASFTTPPLTVTTSYWVRVGSGCGSVDGNTVSVTVTIPAPSSVSATTQATTTQVLIQWSSVATASSYIVEWATNVQGTFHQLPATTQLFATHTITPGSVPVAYVYRLRSVDSAGNASAAVSSIDYAVTGSPLFTDEPIQKRITLVYARHIGELRKAIDALRAAATTPQTPLPPMWQNASNPTGLIIVGPITSLFVPFNEARHAFGFADFAYTGGIAGPQPNGLILSEHVQQIRDALR